MEQNIRDELIFNQDGLEDTDPKKIEYILVHLLRLNFADILPQVISELSELGVVSEPVKDLAYKSSSTFYKTFNRAFVHRNPADVSEFWSSASRYVRDFVEVELLGRGEYGQDMRCKHKLSSLNYSVKRILLKKESLRQSILREVEALSRFHYHPHVIRYYQAWFEKEWEYIFAASSSSSDLPRPEQREYLYIQTEYCPRSLHKMFESYNFDKEVAKKLILQIVRGLAYIHEEGIIHCDLTPMNILLDAQENIKIAGFSHAKFLNQEQVEQVIDASEPNVDSIEDTSQVDRHFYRAPEIEEGGPKIDEKADIYSLGVVCFELLHQFQSVEERHTVLSNLKHKGELPSNWVAKFPEQASFVRLLMSPSPSDRPSAKELLTGILSTNYAFRSAFRSH